MRIDDEVKVLLSPIHAYAALRMGNIGENAASLPEN